MSTGDTPGDPGGNTKEGRTDGDTGCSDHGSHEGPPGINEIEPGCPAEHAKKPAKYTTCDKHHCCYYRCTNAPERVPVGASRITNIAAGISAIAAVLTLVAICFQASIASKANVIYQRQAKTLDAQQASLSSQTGLIKEANQTSNRLANLEESTGEATERISVTLRDTASTLAELRRQTKQQNESAITEAKLANEQASKANKVAEIAANAAAKNATANQSVAIATEESVRQAARVAEKQLRAYVAVVGSRFIFADGYATAVVVFKNTGRTFAHDVVSTGTFICIPRGEPVPTNLGHFNPPPSIGPEGTFVVRRTQEWAGTPVRQLLCQISGAVVYRDEFGKPHQTNFSFEPGRRIPGTDQYEMVYTLNGNDAN